MIVVSIASLILSLSVIVHSRRQSKTITRLADQNYRQIKMLVERAEVDLAIFNYFEEKFKIVLGLVRVENDPFKDCHTFKEVVDKSRQMMGDKK
jgi:hypothetical protein